MADNLAPQDPACGGSLDPPERRKHLRYPYRPGKQVRFLVRPSFQSGVGLLADVSTTGLSLVTDRELTAGTVLVVQLPGRRHGQSCTQLAQVVRAVPHGPSQWLLGCKLTYTLSDEQLFALVWNSAAPPVNPVPQLFVP